MFQSRIDTMRIFFVHICHDNLCWLCSKAGIKNWGTDCFLLNQQPNQIERKTLILAERNGTKPLILSQQLRQVITRATDRQFATSSRTIQCKLGTRRVEFCLAPRAVIAVIEKMTDGCWISWRTEWINSIWGKTKRISLSIGRDRR